MLLNTALCAFVLLLMLPDKLTVIQTMGPPNVHHPVSHSTNCSA